MFYRPPEPKASPQPTNCRCIAVTRVRDLSPARRAEQPRQQPDRDHDHGAEQEVAPQPVDGVEAEIPDAAGTAGGCCGRCSRDRSRSRRAPRRPGSTAGSAGTPPPAASRRESGRGRHGWPAILGCRWPSMHLPRGFEPAHTRPAQGRWGTRSVAVNGDRSATLLTGTF